MSYLEKLIQRSKIILFFYVWANPGLFIVDFRSFHISFIREKLGIRTQGRIMAGKDGSSEIWRPIFIIIGGSVKYLIWSLTGLISFNYRDRALNIKMYQRM